ncbi:hypothetical protein Droror1_Dr00015626 [Drosera rotundifolia]
MFEAPFLLRVRFRGVGRRLERLKVEGGVCPVLLDYWEMRAATEVLQGGLNTRDEGEANSLIFGGNALVYIFGLRPTIPRLVLPSLDTTVSTFTLMNLSGGGFHCKT